MFSINEEEATRKATLSCLLQSHQVSDPVYESNVEIYFYHWSQHNSDQCIGKFLKMQNPLEF